MTPQQALSLFVQARGWPEPWPSTELSEDAAEAATTVAAVAAEYGQPDGYDAFVGVITRIGDEKALSEENEYGLWEKARDVIQGSLEDAAQVSEAAQVVAKSPTRILAILAIATIAGVLWKTR